MDLSQEGEESPPSGLMLIPIDARAASSEMMLLAT